MSSVHKDFRVTFVCNGEPYFYMVAADLRFHVNVGGVTQRIMGEMGIHFVMVSSTGNPLAGGTTPTSQVYLINLFKRPAQQVPASPPGSRPAAFRTILVAVHPGCAETPLAGRV